MRPKIILSGCNSIFHNLALEEVVMQQAKLPVLLLYRNDKTIVIGRNQNPWKEIYVDRMEEDKVALCRRKSGGGAVYQDLGNTCFSFVSPMNSSADYKARNNSILLRALHSLDFEAQVSGRNDITLDGKKISGSAYKIQHLGGSSLSLHHGTMMINVDKTAILKYLNPHKAKLQSKGIESVTSRVINLTEVDSSMNHDKFTEAIRASFLKEYPDAEYLEMADMPPEVESIASEYLEWNWRYGESPHFSHELETRFEWGLLDIHMQVEGGVIKKVKVFSDCLYTDFVTMLERSLLDAQYGEPAIQAILQTSEFPEMTSDLAEWLREKM